jgi:uncharacterized membrane protein YhaH (DUF805 family)
MTKLENYEKSGINYWLGGNKRKLGRLIYHKPLEKNPDSNKNVLIRKLYLIVKVDLISTDTFRRAMLFILCLAISGSIIHHFFYMHMKSDGLIIETIAFLNAFSYSILLFFIPFGYILFFGYNRFLRWFYNIIDDDIKNISLPKIIEFLQAYNFLTEYSKNFKNKDVEILLKYRKMLSDNFINSYEYKEKENELLKKIMISENYLITPFKKFANFRGRASRAEYWGFYFVNTALFILIALAYETFKIQLLQINLFPFLVVSSFIYGCLMLIPSISLNVRRLHDIGLSGWYIVCYIIPIFGQFFSIFVSFKSGTTTPNVYGISKRSMYYRYKNKLDRNMSGQIDYAINRIEGLLKDNRIDHNEYAIIRSDLVQML